MPNVTAIYGRPFDFIAGFDEHSCLKYCIFSQHSQSVCLININILVCQKARCDCKDSLVQLCLFVNFRILLHVSNVITSSNFYNLCVKAEVKR